MLRRPISTLVIVIALTAMTGLFACGRSKDADLWDCQLGVQKGNAGKSAADNAERSRDIVACMEARGYRFDAVNSGCASSTSVSCYQVL